MDLRSFLIPRVRVKDKAQLYENISNLLDGGVTLLSALQGYRDRVTHLGLKSELDNLLFFVEAGDAMSTAMRKLPNLFGEGEIALVEAGEQTGNLQSSFLSLARDLRDQEELTRKLKGALTYPFVILIFLVLAIAIVMMYVIPQIMTIIASSGKAGQLPLSTRSLIATSTFMQDNFWVLLLLFVAVILIAVGFGRTDNGKVFFDTLKMRLPAIGPVYKNYLIVRVMSTLSLLLGSGVTIVKTLRLTGASAGNVVIQSTFSRIAEQVATGKKIVESMRSVDPQEVFFSGNITQMIESAEKTSTVNRVTQKISEQYRREVDTSLAVMVKFIEPFALLLAGLFVMWFAIAIFSAIMQVVQSAGA